MSKGSSANEKLLNIHLLEDLFGWVLVLLMSIILRFTDWYFLDPLLSLGIAAWILYETLPEFRRVGQLFLQAVPNDIDLETLRHHIEKIDHVQAICHLHLWSTDGNDHMMSMIVVTDTDDYAEHYHIKQSIRQITHTESIAHITIELLYDPTGKIKASKEWQC